MSEETTGNMLYNFLSTVGASAICQAMTGGNNVHCEKIKCEDCPFNDQAKLEKEMTALEIECDVKPVRDDD